MADVPTLKSMHTDEPLNGAKLAVLDKLTTEELKKTLAPGHPASLKVRPDGTVLDGHHRIKILRDRGIAINALPREVIARG